MEARIPDEEGRRDAVVLARQEPRLDARLAARPAQPGGSEAVGRVATAAFGPRARSRQEDAPERFPGAAAQPLEAAQADLFAELLRPAQPPQGAAEPELPVALALSEA